MNLFVLDRDPYEAAKAHCDRHCVKMILEIVQMLSTALHYYGVSGAPVKSTHHHHPVSIWLRKTRGNYKWAVKLLDGLLREYTMRYGKVHAYQRYLNYFIMNAGVIADGPLTEHVQCMPDQYKNDDAVIGYRNYYKGEKSKFAKWRNGCEPVWW